MYACVYIYIYMSLRSKRAGAANCQDNYMYNIARYIYIYIYDIPI